MEWKMDVECVGGRMEKTKL